MRSVLIEWLEFCLFVFDSNCRTGCSTQTHLREKAIEVLFRFFFVLFLPRSRPPLSSPPDHLIDLQTEPADPCRGAAAGACARQVCREFFKSKTLFIDTCMTFFFPPSNPYVQQFCSYGSSLSFGGCVLVLLWDWGEY